MGDGRREGADELRASASPLMRPTRQLPIAFRVLLPPRDSVQPRAGQAPSPSIAPGLQVVWRQGMAARAMCPLPLSVSGTPLGHHVTNIDKRRPQEEMVGTNASGVVARVKDIQRPVKRPVMDAVAHSMGGLSGAASFPSELPVSAIVAVSRPLPAPVRSADMTPESLGERGVFRHDPNLMDSGSVRHAWAFTVGRALANLAKKLT